LAGRPDYNYIESPSSRATQLTLATANALIRAKSRALDDIMEEVSRAYIAWLDAHPAANVSAQVTRAGILRMKEGVPWRESGDRESRGCGGTIRTAPIGLFFHDDPERVVETARAVCVCTHAHPSDVASGVMMAYLVSRLLHPRKVPVDALLEEAIAFAATMDAELAKQLRIVRNTLRFSKMAFDYAFPGSGQHGDSALTVGAYHFMRNLERPSHAILQAAFSGDYAKAAAAISGALTGTYHGADALPHGWFPDPLNFDVVVDTASRLHAASVAAATA
jgi:ADP-ribosylglycohydrolase